MKESVVIKDDAWRERLKLVLMLAPALLVIFLLFGGGLLLGLLQSFNYMPIIGLNNPNLDAYKSILSDSEFLLGFALTFYIAFTSTFISMILAIGIALVLRHPFRGKRFMNFLFQLNLPIPHIVGAVGILFLFAQSGFLARIAQSAHAIHQPSDFPAVIYDSWAIGIILEYIWKEVPFLGVIAIANLQSLGEDYEALAQTLGANLWQRFRHVTLPLLMPGLLPASIIVFAFCFGAFEIPYLLGSTYPSTLPVLAYRSYSNIDLNARPEAMAMSMVIALLVIALIFLYMVASRRWLRSD